MRLKFAAGTFLFIMLIASFPVRAQNPAGFTSKDADVDGLKLHYTTGGHGPAVVLLHGFAETSRMWTPILPALGEKFTVIAPDLPGGLLDPCKQYEYEGRGDQHSLAGALAGHTKGPGRGP